MAKILNFPNNDENNNNDNIKFQFPTKEQVQNQIAAADSYDTDEMVRLGDWDGGCWEKLFHICEDTAEEYNLASWDIFAALMHNLFESVQKQTTHDIVEIMKNGGYDYE